MHMEQEDVQQLTKKERRELRRQERSNEQEKMRARRRATRAALWGGTAVGIALVITGIVFLVLRGSDNSEINSTTLSVSSGDWIKGNPEARVALIEYGDFQCPACASFYPVVKAISGEFKDNVAVVFRHFPLSQIHKNANLSSRAAEAAGLQGKFWEMHDKLFERQKVWADLSDEKAKELFISYVSEIGLDTERFKQDIESDAVRSAVEEDYNEGLKARVNGTPTFFLNGSRISNPSNYDEFKSLIESKLSDANIPTS